MIEVEIIGEEKRCDDCISRQAAIDAVSDALERVFVEHEDVAEKILCKVPSAEPDIVRCKDCRYVWNEDGWDNLWCNRLTGSFSVEKDGGCSWGKI